MLNFAVNLNLLKKENQKNKSTGTSAGAEGNHSLPQAGSTVARATAGERRLHPRTKHARGRPGTGGSKHGASGATQQGQGGALRGVTRRASRKFKQLGLVFTCDFEKWTCIFAVVVTKGISCVECKSDSCQLTSDSGPASTLCFPAVPCLPA